MQLNRESLRFINCSVLAPLISVAFATRTQNRSDFGNATSQIAVPAPWEPLKRSSKSAGRNAVFRHAALNRIGLFLVVPLNCSAFNMQTKPPFFPTRKQFILVTESYKKALKITGGNCCLQLYSAKRSKAVRWIQEGFKGGFLQKHLDPIRGPFLGDSVRILGFISDFWAVTPTFGL